MRNSACSLARTTTLHAHTSASWENGLGKRTHGLLTVTAQKAVEELEERERVPGVGGLRLQAGVHVSLVQRQEGLSVFHQQLRPPGEGLETPQKNVNRLEPLSMLANADVDSTTPNVNSRAPPSGRK